MCSRSLLRRVTSTSLISLGLASCERTPTTPVEFGPPSGPFAVAHPVVVPTPSFTCTRSWLFDSDGDWDDPGKWLPYGVPIESDNVCISAAGTYEVTLDHNVAITTLQVGGSSGLATLVFRAPPNAEILLWEDLVIDPTGRLEVRSEGNTTIGRPWGTDGQPTSAGTLVNRGTIEVTDECACGDLLEFNFESYSNAGWMDLTAPMALVVEDGGAFLNTGFMVTDGDGEVELYDDRGQGAHFEHRSGTIAGSAPFVVRSQGLGFLNVHWSGGTLPARTGMTDSATVVLDGAPALELSSPTLNGRLDLRYVPAFEFETIGAGVHIRAWPGTYLNLFPGRGDAFTNEGRLDIEVAGGQTTDLQGSRNWVINRGILAVHGGGTIDFQQDSLINHGTITLEGRLHLSGQQRKIRNAGQFTVESGGAVEVVDGTFGSTPAGSMTGELVLEGGTLQGFGSVGRVISRSGTIQPGFPIGALSVASLDLDPGSRTVIEIAETATDQHDMLEVRGPIRYGGTLEVITLPPFEGGRCGQVVPIVVGGFTALPGSTFRSFSGLIQGGSQAWRLNHAPGEVALAGYRRGSAPLYATTAVLALSEGGRAECYHVCLGSTEPVAPVVVVPTSLRGEVTLSSALTFDATNWALPREVTVRAVDDTQVEGPHQDFVLHRRTSTDPTYGTGSTRDIAIALTDNDGNADLAALKVAQEDNKFLGDSMNTTFRVTNAGPTESSGSIVTSTPLTGLAFVSATGASCAVDGSGVVTCDIGPMAPGAQVDFVITFQGVAVGVHSSTWTVTGADPDPDTTNDAAVYSQRVN